ncbi:MAG: fused MFS/spermidine synthase [Pseudonocardiaceae bacterium]
MSRDGFSVRLARSAVLVAGAAILVVETLATRLVAPYVGLTLESTTAAIGVALLGIAAGATWGGRLADALPPRRVVTGALAVGGLLVLAVRPLVRIAGPTLGAGPLAALLLVGFSTLGAVTALAMVGPAVTRARLTGLDDSGSVVGSLSAMGTLGSLAGTFLTGFVLVALLPVAAILAVTAAACLLLALVTATHRPRRTVGTTMAAAVVLGVALVGVQGPCEVDTTYFCARVETDPLRPAGRVLVLDDLRHSYVDLADPTHLELGYTRRLVDTIDTAFPDGEPLDAVHIGGGGFTMPRFLAATRPGSASTVLELDPGVVEIGRRKLAVDDIPGVDIRVGDARTSLQALPDDSADLVVGDAFGSRSVPWHLATREFLVEVARVLRPGGVYLLNVIDYDPLDFLAAETATAAAVFDEVGLLVSPGHFEDGEGGNAVLAATDAGLAWSGPERRAAAAGEDVTVLDPAAAAGFAAGAPVLTDSYAPVDQLMNPYGTG